MKVMSISNNNQNPQFRAKLENTPALVDYITRLPLSSRDEFYKLMEAPETIKKIRDIKIDGAEPIMGIGYLPENGEVNNASFLMNTNYAGIKSSVVFSPEKRNSKDFVDYLINAMKNLAEKVQDSGEYIDSKLKPIIEKINE